METGEQVGGDGHVTGTGEKSQWGSGGQEENGNEWV